MCACVCMCVYQKSRRAFVGSFGCLFVRAPSCGNLRKAIFVAHGENACGKMIQSMSRTLPSSSPIPFLLSFSCSLRCLLRRSAPAPPDKCQLSVSVVLAVNPPTIAVKKQ